MFEGEEANFTRMARALVQDSRVKQNKDVSTPKNSYKVKEQADAEHEVTKAAAKDSSAEIPSTNSNVKVEPVENTFVEDLVAQSARKVIPTPPAAKKIIPTPPAAARPDSVLNYPDIPNPTVQAKFER